MLRKVDGIFEIAGEGEAFGWSEGVRIILPPPGCKPHDMSKHYNQIFEFGYR